MIFEKKDLTIIKYKSDKNWSNLNAVKIIHIPTGFTVISQKAPIFSINLTRALNFLKIIL